MCNTPICSTYNCSSEQCRRECADPTGGGGAKALFTPGQDWHNPCRYMQDVSPKFLDDNIRRQNGVGQHALVLGVGNSETHMDTKPVWAPEMELQEFFPFCMRYCCPDHRLVLLAVLCRAPFLPLLRYRSDIRFGGNKVMKRILSTLDRKI